MLSRMSGFRKCDLPCADLGSEVLHMKSWRPALFQVLRPAPSVCSGNRGDSYHADNCPGVAALRPSIWERCHIPVVPAIQELSDDPSGPPIAWFGGPIFDFLGTDVRAPQTRSRIANLDRVCG